jgi:hypothetical protein
MRPGEGEDVGAKKVKWDKLHSAKQELVKLIWQRPTSELWVLVDFINECQQRAIDSDLWSFPDKPGVVRKPSDLDPKEGDLCWDTNRAVGMQWRHGQWEDVDYDYWVASHEERK